MKGYTTIGFMLLVHTNYVRTLYTHTRLIAINLHSNSSNKNYCNCAVDYEKICVHNYEVKGILYMKINN